MLLLDIAKVRLPNKKSKRLLIFSFISKSKMINLCLLITKTKSYVWRYDGDDE